MRSGRGFSRIELVIVVMIIGVIGAIAIPRLSRGSEGARINAFVSELNTFAKLIEQYELETGDDVSDSTTGRMPAELKGYLHQNSWEGPTPIGGHWDIEKDDNGVSLAVGVHFDGERVDLEAVQAVDEIVDDGNTKTGHFRALDDERYYLILE